MYIFLFPLAPEEDGWQNSQIPSPQQWDFCHPEQVPEVWRWRKHAGRTCPMLPATDTPVTCQQLRCCSHSLKMWTSAKFQTLDQTIHCWISNNILHFLKVFSSNGPLNVTQLGHILSELFFVFTCALIEMNEYFTYWMNHLFYTCRML